MFNQFRGHLPNKASRGTTTGIWALEESDDTNHVLKRQPSGYRRSILKKARPHSWHSNLQKGFQRARSRSSGRDKDNGKAQNRSSTIVTSSSSQLYRGSDLVHHDLI